MISSARSPTTCSSMFSPASRSLGPPRGPASSPAAGVASGRTSRGSCSRTLPTRSAVPAPRSRPTWRPLSACWSSPPAFLLFCFVGRQIRQPVTDISAPVLEMLWWCDGYYLISVHLGEMAHPQKLCSLVIMVYGPPHYPYNWDSVMLLQRFQKLQILDLIIAYPTEVEIYGWSGAEREFEFLKRLLRWAAVLKAITITSDPSVTVSEEHCQELLGHSGPETSMMIYLYRDGAKVMYAKVG